MNTAGHLSTVRALVRRLLFPAEPPVSTHWSTTPADLERGTFPLRGRFNRPTGARDLVVLVHGLGGSSESGYLMSAAARAAALGLASLRLNLRGADGEDGDFYHGGLTADLHAAVSSLARLDFERILVLGFSLGGHVVLRFATEVREPKVKAVAAASAPLDLAAGANAMDRALMAPYRAYVMRRLKKNYENTARRCSVPTPPARVRRARTLREWDSLTVVPRFGFESADDYYTKASVGPRLDRLRCPALLVVAEDDPMVPPSAIRPALEALEARRQRLAVRWLKRGGHLGFSNRLDLGIAGPKGLDSQLLLWLLRPAVTTARARRAEPSRTNGGRTDCR